MRLLPCGDAALIAELDGLEEVLSLTRAVEAARAAGDLEQVVETVPAARTLLLKCRPGYDGLTHVARRLRALSLPDRVELTGEDVEIPVRYDGPDLDEVARLTGLGEDELVAAHTGARWTVAFTGFAPGFGYLVGDDPRLEVPRRDDPRTKVPAGSVGLAGEFSGVYPRESPGGWQLIGCTEEVLWDPKRDPPALLSPGTRVRFVRSGS